MNFGREPPHFVSDHSAVENFTLTHVVILEEVSVDSDAISTPSKNSLDPDDTFEGEEPDGFVNELLLVVLLPAYWTTMSLVMLLERRQALVVEHMTAG